MLPNVKVTVNEEINLVSSRLNTFLPLLILKTKTGPIGTETLIKNEKKFIEIFGTPDSSTPEAFGVLQYIKSYGQAYIVRVVGTGATEATAKIKVSSTDLVDIKSNYKTDTLNGVEVAIVSDTTNNKLYIETTIEGKVIDSIKENITYSSAKADELEKALDKIINSFNESQSYITLTNLYTGKTSEDTKPSSLDNAKATLSAGVSGNSSVSDAEVIKLIENYRGSDLGIDAILVPGFESVEVVTKLANVAHDSSFIAISNISGTSAESIASTALTYPNNESLALYAGKVCFYEDPTIFVPASIAAMSAYITKSTSSKWLAPAGVTRGTLSNVANMEYRFSDSELETLYTNVVPVNGIKKISGRGFIVWGQKTTASDNYQYEDRINVVRLIKYLTKEIYSISYDYLFEPITDYTYNSWTLRVESLLDDIKVGNGLSAYRVIMDDTLNTEETKKENKLIGQVKFKPLEAAEFIEINFVVTDSVEGSEA